MGGIIPLPDQTKLKEMGVAACFGAGTSMEAIVDFLSLSKRDSDDVSSLVRQLEHGDRTAMPRLLTLAADGIEAELFSGLVQSTESVSTPVVALTGSGGVGKSSLLGELAAHYDQQGQRVGVLACDPESPITGGALLGDRCRIAGDSERVYVRSVATTPGQQGVAPNIETMLSVMKTAGFDRIFIETVGAGQSDVRVRSVADVVVLVLQPQTGDELQWEKAGVLEIANMVVVNKADLPGSDQTVAELTQQLRGPNRIDGPDRQDLGGAQRRSGGVF